MKKIKVTFEGHSGIIYLDENDRVEFYRLSFKNMMEATLFLKNIKPPDKNEDYNPWFYKGKKGLLSTLDGQVFHDNRWLPDDNFAEDYIKMRT